MRSFLIDDILRDWKKVHRLFDEFPIEPCFFAQEMPARAIDDAYIPVWQARCALRFGFRLEQFA